MSQTRRKSRFWMYAPFILLAILMAAYSAYWFVMRGELEKGIDDWIDEQRAAGIEISFSEKRLDGFPFRFALTLDDPVYSEPGDGLSWGGEQLQLVMQPWNWNHVLGRSVGANVIETSGGEFDVQLGSKSVGSLSWDETSIRRISIVLDEADISLGGAPFGKLEDFALHLRPASDNADTLQIVAEWQAIHMEQALTETLAVLGNDLQPSLMQVELTEAFPVINSSAGLSDWHGRVKIARMLLNWGPAKIGMKGDFSLDGCGVPEDGNVQVRLDDVPALRSVMHEARMLDLQGEVGLSTLEGESKDGGFLKLTFRDGGIYYGLLPLGDLPQGC